MHKTIQEYLNNLKNKLHGKADSAFHLAVWAGKLQGRIAGICWYRNKGWDYE